MDFGARRSVTLGCAKPLRSMQLSPTRNRVCRGCGNFGPNVSVYPAACDGSNVISVGAVIDSQEWAQSGKGDIYAEGRVQAVPASVYHYEGAQEAARTGDYGRAREGYHASLEAEENAPALFGLALLDLHSGDLEFRVRRPHSSSPTFAERSRNQSHLGSARLMQQRPAGRRGRASTGRLPLIQRMCARSPIARSLWSSSASPDWLCKILPPRGRSLTKGRASTQ